MIHIRSGVFTDCRHAAARICIALVAAALLALGSAPAAQAQSFQFSTVEITGNQRISDADILAFAQVPRNQQISAAALNDAFQRIEASGLFETVEIIPRGNRLVIRVVEYPIISRINIEGNDRFDDDTLLPLVQSQPRRVYSPAMAEADAAALTNAYQSGGRLSATVTPRIIPREGGRVDLVFEVEEARVVEIERISFVGNRAFSDGRLRRVLESKQANLFRGLISRDTYAPERVEFDRQVLTDFYQSRGYVDFQILSVAPEVSRERDATFLTFTIREGQSFDFGNITATTDVPGIDAAEFLAASRIREGRTYTPALVENTITRMERLALEKRLDFIRVEPIVTRNERDLLLDIEFRITRGPRVFVERIDIEGNQTTLDRVIRRQFRTVEGDPFNPRAIRAAAERIRALGFFADVDVQTRQGSSEDQVIVDVDVTEQPTGSFGFGASYSVANGLGFVVTFSESNFLGRGQNLQVDLNTTGSTGRSAFRFTEPAFLGRDVALGFGISQAETSRDNAFYSTKELAADVSLRFPIGEQTDATLRYGISLDEIYDVDDGSSVILQDEADERLTSALGYTLTFDSRTSGLNPNAGVLLSFGQDFAGLGGDVRSVRTTARVIGQTRVRNEEVTLRATLEGGALNMLGGDVSTVNDRYFLSSRQLRGFAYKGVGPRDFTADNQDVLGGNYFVSARLEGEFPLGLPEEFGLTGGVFLDAASVWGLDNTAGTAGTVDDDLAIRSSIGVSLFWTTPIGPLVFSYARPLEKEPGDEVQYFDVTISTRF